MTSSWSIISSGRRRTIASDIRLDYTADSFSWSPDSKHIAFRTGGQNEHNNDCYVIDLKDGSKLKISAFAANSSELPHRTLKPLWDASGKALYFLWNGELWKDSLAEAQAKRVAGIPQWSLTQLITVSDNVVWTGGRGSAIVLAHDREGNEDGFYKIDLADGRATLLRGGGCYTCSPQNTYVATSEDQSRAAYFAEDAQHPAAVWLTDADFHRPREAIPLNPEFDHYEMGQVKLIHWLSDDGEPLQGALLLPADYQAGKRYPLIVFVYGGSYLSKDLYRFGLAPYPLNMQLLSTRGYAVLLPDSPQHVGMPMLDVAKSVLPGITRVIEMQIADPERIGVMGHSNGGYATLALLVQTRRFRAAVEIAGMADLLTDYGEMASDGTAFSSSVLEHGQDALGGSPWEVRERYIENSPLLFFDRVETPLLLVHGELDSAVSPYLGDQAFVALRRLGKEAEYAKYSGEEHDPATWSSFHQLDLWARMIRWFDTYLGKWGPL